MRSVLVAFLALSARGRSLFRPCIGEHLARFDVRPILAGIFFEQLSNSGLYLWRRFPHVLLRPPELPLIASLKLA